MLAHANRRIDGAEDRGVGADAAPGAIQKQDVLVPGQAILKTKACLSS
jgi:hypothetical protein